MKRLKDNFIKILQIEIEDLNIDIEELIQQCSRDNESGNLTNYVFWENLTVFKNELLGLKAFDKILNEVSTDEFNTLDELVNHLKDKFRTAIKSHGLVEAIYKYVERKIDKAAGYVDQKDTV